MAQTVAAFPPETQRRRRGHNFYPPLTVRAKIPAIGATEGRGDSATVHAHYFGGSGDWYVIELDPATGEAFGWAELFPGGGEYGYFSLPEMETVNVRRGLVIVERDCHWSPRSIRDVLAERR